MDSHLVRASILALLDYFHSLAVILAMIESKIIVYNEEMLIFSLEQFVLVHIRRDKDDQKKSYYGENYDNTYDENDQEKLYT